MRELDKLHHSVQNASYEQKDPLLIFKLESVTLFDSMVNTINNNTISVLMRGQIPVQRIGQQAALIEAHIAGGRADEPGHRMLFHVFAHVEALEMNGKRARELAGHLGLAHPGRPGEEE